MAEHEDVPVELALLNKWIVLENALVGSLRAIQRSVPADELTKPLQNLLRISEANQLACAALQETPVVASGSGGSGDQGPAESKATTPVACSKCGEAYLLLLMLV